jgi:hypothetical protein
MNCLNSSNDIVHALFVLWGEGDQQELVKLKGIELI